MEQGEDVSELYAESMMVPLEVAVVGDEGDGGEL